jgi:hypothetical protein
MNYMVVSGLGLTKMDVVIIFVCVMYVLCLYYSTYLS